MKKIHRYFCSRRQGVKEHHGDTCSHRPSVRPRKGSPVNPNKEMKTKIQRISSPLWCPESQNLLARPRKGASSIEDAVTWKLVDTSSKSTSTRSRMHSYTKSYLTFCYCFSLFNLARLIHIMIFVHTQCIQTTYNTYTGRSWWFKLNIMRSPGLMIPDISSLDFSPGVLGIFYICKQKYNRGPNWKGA